MKILLWAILFALAGCTAHRYSLTIVHTNDIHGHFAPERAAWRKDSAMVGGFAALAGALDSVRAADKETIYLDAGDLMTGNPICNMVVDGVEGRALQHMLELCRCDAAALGNHEFDLGPEHLRQFVETEHVNYVCGNLLAEDGDALCPSYKIIERGGLRIGVIGLILNDLATVVSKTALAEFEVRDISATAQELIDEVDPLTDVVVLLTHNGVESDKELARNIRGCDIIVGGHSHTRLSEPEIENGVIIVQAGSYLKQMGVLQIEVRKDEVTKHRGHLIELEAARFSPSPEITSYAAAFADQIAREYGDVIATAGADIARNYNASSPLGNLLCDMLRDGFHTDFALINSGGIRKDLSSGAITKLDIVEMLPFVNTIVSFSATGQDLITFAKRQVRAQTGSGNEILQMSGIEIRYSIENENIDSLDVKIDGQSVLPDSLYTGVSIDYVLKSQAEKYLGFEPVQMQETGTLLSDYVIQVLQDTHTPIAPNAESRLIRE